DLRMGQCRTELDRMRGARQVAAAVDAQGFAFDAAQTLAEQGAVLIVVEQGKAALELVRLWLHTHGCFLSYTANAIGQRVTEKRGARRRPPHSLGAAAASCSVTIQ